jgi:Ca-activated chloride channel homolog
LPNICASKQWTQRLFAPLYMLLANLLKLRFFRLIPLAFLLALCCGVSSRSQSTVAPQPQTQSNSWNPTQPEVQPPLNVDRDPVPSPDVTQSANSSSELAPGASGTPVKKSQNGIYTYRTNVDEVLLDCTVIDEKGQTVNDLTQRDFRVWENGVPQTINSVEHEDAPVSMGILIDNSGSMRDKRGAVNAAAYKFLLNSNRKDEAFVVNFSDRAYLDQGFTTSLTALDRGLSHFDSKGTTALYDAVAASAGELAKQGKHRNEVLLIVTDGADDASHLTLQEAIRRVQNLGGPVVYAIGLTYEDSRAEAQRAGNALEALTSETGGVAYFPPSLQDVGEIASKVASEIRHQYVIDYHSSEPFSMGGYRTVRVEVSAPHHGKLYVRTKRGYYAKKESRSQVAQNARQ